MEDIKVILSEANEEELRFSAFDEKEGILGEMLVSILPDDFLIEGIYVLEKHRRQGVATALLDYFFDSMPEELIRPVQCIFDLDEEGGQELYALLEQREDFLVSGKKSKFQVSVKKITEAIFGAKKTFMQKKYATKKISDLPDSEMKKIKEIFVEEGIYDSSSMKKLEDCCEVNFSMVAFNEDESVAAVIVQKPEKGACVINAMGLEDESEAAQLLFDACYSLCKKDDSLKIVLPVYDECIQNIIDTLGLKEETDKEETDSDRTVVASWTMTQAYNLI